MNNYFANFKRYLTLLTIFSLNTLLFAQGSISGNITDTRTGEALAGANVLIEGLGIGTTS